jgi:hypothetical protein
MGSSLNLQLHDALFNYPAINKLLRVLYGAAMHWMQNQTSQPEDYVENILYIIKMEIHG